MKRIIGLLLCVIMIISVMPAAVFAQNDTGAKRYTVLVLDVSGGSTFLGSNNQTIYTADTAISYVKQAANKFVSDILEAHDSDCLAVVSYTGSATLVSDFTSDISTIKGKINNLSAGSKNSTSIHSGLEYANKVLDSISDSNAEKNIVLFTTGFTNTGSHTYTGHYSESTIASSWRNLATGVRLYAYANSAYNVASTLKQKSTVYVCGLFQTMQGMPDEGKPVAEFFKLTAQDLASSPSHFYNVENPEDLEIVFEQIAETIINPLQLDLTYDYNNIDAKETEINIYATVTNTSNQEAVNALVRLKETPGFSLTSGESLEHSLGNIPANQSRKTSWKVRVATPNGEKEYIQNVVVGSANSVAVERSLLIKIAGAVDAVSFAQDDFWGFTHGSVANYTIDDDSLEYLLSYYTNNTERDNLESAYHRTITSRNGWGGSCHGMSVGALLFKLNRLTPEYWNKDADCINDLNVDDARSLINYYFIMQYTPQQKAVFTSTRRNGDDANIERIISMVKSSAIAFGFQWDGTYRKACWVGTEKKEAGSAFSGGHTIILYGNPEYNETGWNINGTNYRNRIKAYDINYNGTTTYFFYDKDTNYRWTVGPQEYYNNEFKQLTSKSINFVTNNMSDLDFRNIENRYNEEQLQKDAMAYFTAYNLTNAIRVMDKTGRYVDIDGLITDGTLDCITYYNNKAVDGVDADPELNIAFNTVQEYSIQNTEKSEELDVSVDFGNISMSSEVSNADSVTFAPDGRVSFKGDKCEYELSLVANEGNYTTPWYKTSVYGSNANNVSVSNGKNGIVIDGDNLKNLVISTTDDAKEKTQLINTKENSVLVTSDTENNPIVMVDSDDNGTYDQQIKTYAISGKWDDMKKSQIILTIGEKDIIIFGEVKEFDVAPKIVNGRTMLPIRAIAEALGAKVDWDGVAREVTITKGYIKIVITVDSDKATINGQTITLDSPAFIENDRTYLPVRFGLENLGAKVEWVEDIQQIIISM